MTWSIFAHGEACQIKWPYLIDSVIGNEYQLWQRADTIRPQKLFLPPFFLVSGYNRGWKAKISYFWVPSPQPILQWMPWDVFLAKKHRPSLWERFPSLKQKAKAHYPKPPATLSFPFLLPGMQMKSVDAAQPSGDVRWQSMRTKAYKIEW